MTQEVNNISEETMQKIREFDKQVGELQRKYGLEMYAANQAMDNGEVITVIKIRETKKEVYDKSKKRNTANQEA
jgi:hypothetical protein